MWTVETRRSGHSYREYYGERLARRVFRTRHLANERWGEGSVWLWTPAGRLVEVRRWDADLDAKRPKRKIRQ